MPHPTGTVYPTTLDAATTLGSVVDGTDGVFDEDHNVLRDAIFAVERRVGKNSSLDAASFDYRVSGLEALHNPIVNPGFEFNTRGAASYAGADSGAQSLDRWGALKALSTLTVVPETTIVDVGSSQSAKVTHNYVANGYGQLYQYIEDFYQYRGKTITFAVRVRSNYTGVVRAIVGDGISYSYGSFNATANAFETLYITANISVSATYLSVIVSFELGSCTAYIDNATFGISSSPIVYALLPIALETEKCRRYLEVHGGVFGGPPTIAMYSLASSIAAEMISFVAEKPGVSTITVAGGWTYANTVNALPVITNVTKYGYKMYVVSTAQAQTLMYPTDTTGIITAEYNS